ncbi:hypothetical protein [Xanthomonas hortorum]|uniref:hypothetical protein n=1 Tax=Xanthomonas hortorum TaxID=56454 RepID=UPI0032E88EB2
MIMAPRLRKFALTTHVIFSVGLLGAIAAFLALALAGLTADKAAIVRATYLAMDVTARFVIVPLAFASLLTGLIQSLGTSWGLFRHYWILAKLLLTVFATAIVLAKIRLIGYAAHLAAETILPRADLRMAGMELAVHAAGGLLVLLVPAILSMYKPRGLTIYGQRKQHEQRTSSQKPYRSPKVPFFGHSADIGGGARSGSITITLRRGHIVGITVAVLVLHAFILHLTGAMLGGH